jgi:hypothetical protein
LLYGRCHVPPENAPPVVALVGGNDVRVTLAAGKQGALEAVLRGRPRWR